MSTKLTIKNIADFRTTPRTSTLIHMTAEQWKHTTRDMPILTMPGKQDSDEHDVLLTAIPDPDGGVVIFPVCRESGPETLCMVRPRYSNGMITFECFCRPKKPNVQPGSGFLPVRQRCKRGFTVSNRPDFRCQRDNCSGNCRDILRKVELPYGLVMFIFDCECV